MSVRQKKLLSGAVQTGLGVSLLGAIVKVIRDAKRTQDAELGSGADRVIRITPPLDDDELPVKVASLVPDLLVYGGVTAAAALALDKLFAHVEQKRLKREIDDADEVYNAGLHNLKTAGIVSEALTDLPTQLALLSFLAGGVGTYATLEKNFPKRKLKNLEQQSRPRRVVVEGYGTLIPDGKADGPLVNEKEKAASSFEVNLEDDDIVKAAALAYSTLAEAIFQEGGRSSLIDLAADPQAEKKAMDLGAEAILDSPDMRSNWRDMSATDRFDSACHLFESPVLCKTAATLFQAELHDREPELALAASNLCHNDKMAILLPKFAALMVG